MSAEMRNLMNICENRKYQWKKSDVLRQLAAQGDQEAQQELDYRKTPEFRDQMQARKGNSQPTKPSEKEPETKKPSKYDWEHIERMAKVVYDNCMYQGKKGGYKATDEYAAKEIQDYDKVTSDIYSTLTAEEKQSIEDLVAAKAKFQDIFSGEFNGIQVTQNVANFFKNQLMALSAKRARVDLSGHYERMGDAARERGGRYYGGGGSYYPGRGGFSSRRRR